MGNTFMYISLITISLLIVFSSISLFEQKDLKKILTAKVVKEIDENKDKVKISGKELNDGKGNINSEEKELKEGKLYSAKTYFFYYLVIVILVFSLIVLSFKYFLPYFKEYS